jgi:hypothetical protein
VLLARREPEALTPHDPPVGTSAAQMMNPVESVGAAALPQAEAAQATVRVVAMGPFFSGGAAAAARVGANSSRSMVAHRPPRPLRGPLY